MTDITPSGRAVCRATRVRIQLTLADSFNRAQVAYLMGQAKRWGAEDAYDRGLRDGMESERQRISELNLDAIRAAVDTPAFSERFLRMEGYRRRARLEADMAAGVSWRGDHPGGPVPVWGLDDEAIERAEALTTALEGMPRVHR